MKLSIQSCGTAAKGIGGLLLILLLSAASLAWAQTNGTPVARLQQMFHDASKAYDEGRFEDAAELYARLLADGYPSREVYFNAGNANFKLGRVGPAALNYRRAWYLAPRDPDIHANLRLTLQGAGATLSRLPSYARLLTTLSRSEWIAASVTFYWLLAAAVAFWLTVPRFRGLALRLAIVCALLLLIALAGLGVWSDLCRKPEVVIVGGRQEALFAPLEQNATPHFALSEGSIARAVDLSGDWVKVEADGRAGWIRRQACEPVCPWSTAWGENRP